MLLGLLSLAAVPGFGPERTIPDRMFGLNSDDSLHFERRREPGRIQAAVDAAAAVHRYPGGTLANYWDVRNSRLFRDSDRLNPQDGDPREWTRTKFTIGWVHQSYGWLNPHPISENAAWMRRQPGAVPATILVANMITPGIDWLEARDGRPLDRRPRSTDHDRLHDLRIARGLELIAQARSAGIRLRGMELGNEFYFGASMVSDDAPAVVEPYSAGAWDSSQANAPVDVGAFPDSDLTSYSRAANRWAAAVRAGNPGLPLAAVAAWVGSDGVGDRTKWWNRDALAGLSPTIEALTLHVYGGPQVGSLTGTEGEFAAAMASWRGHWEAGLKRSGLPAGRRLWITEFNVDDEFGETDRLPESKGTWGNGMGNLWAAFHLLRHEPRVDVLLLHELERVIAPGDAGLTAHGLAWSLLCRSSAGRDRVRMLGSDTDPVQAAEFRSSTGSAEPVVLAANFGDHPLPLPPPLAARSGTAWAIDRGSLTPPLPRPISAGTLPARSISVLPGGAARTSGLHPVPARRNNPYHERKNHR